MSGRRRGRHPHFRIAPAGETVSGETVSGEAASGEAAFREAASREESGGIQAPALVGVPVAVDVVRDETTDSDAGTGRASCTLAQLRRFIKSRPYVPLHELRRRFGIEGDEDEVSPVGVPDGVIYVGLPAAEARLLGELVKAGDVGYELLHDPISPAVIGVYPMRPVARG